MCLENLYAPFRYRKLGGNGAAIWARCICDCDMIQRQPLKGNFHYDLGHLNCNGNTIGLKYQTCFQFWPDFDVIAIMMQLYGKRFSNRKGPLIYILFIAIVNAERNKIVFQKTGPMSYYFNLKRSYFTNETQLTIEIMQKK